MIAVLRKYLCYALFILALLPIGLAGLVDPDLFDKLARAGTMRWLIDHGTVQYSDLFDCYFIRNPDHNPDPTAVH